MVVSSNVTTLRRNADLLLFLLLRKSLTNLLKRRRRNNMASYVDELRRELESRGIVLEEVNSEILKHTVDYELMPPKEAAELIHEILGEK